EGGPARVDPSSSPATTSPRSTAPRAGRGAAGPLARWPSHSRATAPLHSGCSPFSVRDIPKLTLRDPHSAPERLFPFAHAEGGAVRDVHSRERPGDAESVPRLDPPRRGGPSSRRNHERVRVLRRGERARLHALRGPAGSTGRRGHFPAALQRAYETQQADFPSALRRPAHDAVA